MENSRFKFRFWSKRHNCFVDADLWECNNGDSFPVWADGNLLSMEKKGSVIIEQCTGLKDKNGKFIYENDLVKCPIGIYRIAVDDFGLWTVVYKNNPLAGVGEWSDFVRQYAFNQNNGEIEILGNIHENPELVE